MNPIQVIFDIFTGLNSKQKEQINALAPLYEEWNQKVNVISRKDMDYFYSRHVLHSLLIGHFSDLSGSTILDVGTGGGFPGLPLAILFPDAEFTLVDSIGKKLKVIDDVADQIGVCNIKTVHSRMEELNGKYDFVTGRAVKSLPVIFNWTKHLICWNKGKEKSGMLYLKGGDFIDELKSIPRKVDIIELQPVVPLAEFFETKKLVHIYQAKP
jgi:16S rRNA (guanine527-N7)-methyltransferase